jgi:hypothetical protein
LDGPRGVVCFVLCGQSALGHHAEGVCGTDLDDALSGLLAEDDILCLDPSHGRGELVCQQLNEQRVCELLLDFGTHVGESVLESRKECVWRANGLGAKVSSAVPVAEEVKICPVSMSLLAGIKIWMEREMEVD